MADKDLSQVNETELKPSRIVYPIVQAIKELAPGCSFSLEGWDYDGLRWMDDPSKKPTREAVMAKAKEMYEQIPLKRLRKERDARMKEVDWVTLRSMRTGEPIPQEWKDYMQALADITKTYTPVMAGGELVGVPWPERPDGQPTGFYRGGA